MRRALWCIPVALLATGLAAMPTSPPNLTLALETQEKLVAEQPSNAKARNDLGNLLVAAKRFEEAEAAYEAALALAPDDAAAHFNLAVLYQQTGRRRKAQDQYQKLLEIDPRNPWAHYQLGVLLEGRGQRGPAIEHYAKAFAYDNGLTFASNNPQLIENQLVTEALLQASRYREPPGAQVPRQYGDPGRIRSLLLDPPAPADETSDESPAGATGGSAGAAAAMVEETDATLGGGSRPKSRALTNDDLRESRVGQTGNPAGAPRRGGSPGYRPAPPLAPGVPQRRQVPPPGAQANRSGIPAQLPTTDRQLGGTVIGDPADEDGTDEGATSEKPNAGTTRQPTTRPGGPIVSPQPGGVSRGGTSRRSTSQLDLKLLPERMPEERYAQAEPGSKG